MTAESSVVYPNAPVRLVVLAVGFPETSISKAEAEALRTALRPKFPLREKFHEQSLVVDLVPGAGARQEVRSFPRFSTRDRQVTMAVTGTSVVIEARTYEGFDWYVDLIRGPLEAVESVVQPDGVTSIGHRFIDEVHLPEGTLQLAPWFDQALLAMPTLLDVPIDGWQAVISYRLDHESQMTLRYGPLDAPLVPSPEGKVQTFSTPVVGLDWDSNWQPKSIPEFTASAILDQLSVMYAPVRSLFHQVCTDQLRHTFEAEPTERTG